MTQDDLELLEALPGLRRDAARYRWLVENAVIEFDAPHGRVHHDGKDPASTKTPLDHAIDAAGVAPFDPTQDHVQLARKIIVTMGRRVEPSSEPGADYMVDRIAVLIAAAGVEGTPK